MVCIWYKCSGLARFAPLGLTLYTVYIPICRDLSNTCTDSADIALINALCRNDISEPHTFAGSLGQPPKGQMIYAYVLQEPLAKALGS